MPPAFEAVLDQALQLPDEERGALATQLLRSLDPDDGDESAPQEWEAMWSAELDRRIREVRDGSVELIDGDEVLAELREIVDRP
jgi:putative addiction module component (TIGR02574 family)